MSPRRRRPCATSRRRRPCVLSERLVASPRRRRLLILSRWLRGRGVLSSSATSLRLRRDGERRLAFTSCWRLPHDVGRHGESRKGATWIQERYTSRNLQLSKRESVKSKPKKAAAAKKDEVRTVPTVPELQALLRGAGLRSTVSRIAVLEHFYEHGGRKSHADIFEALDDRGFDRASIYRILMDLADAKILSRTDLGDHIWRFELLRDGASEHAEQHPHFVCVDCGQVSCLPDVTVKLSGRRPPKSVAAKKVSIQLKGICDDCT
ncbi:MAG: transcriptional repressor [Labilithrix sp.]|nr:transcriptional repressor [Labilithrix sp.]MCW5812641.1 transcriptional repressor [Labilithrix sp.]